VLLASENYDAWLSQAQALELDGDLLRVGVAKVLHRDWLQHTLGGRIEGALQYLE
jgi:hypothetical protein